MTIKKIIRWVFILLTTTLFVYYFYPESQLSSNIKIDSIVICKSKRELLAYSNGRLIKTYKVSLGKNSIGDKEFEGDKKTPEGIYYINAKNPNSGYYKNLGISYPNEQDIEYSRKLGKPTGGDIKIHGLRNGIGFIGKFQRWFDWTAGCIALTNKEVDELYNNVEIGTKIEIIP
ncbi:MAG: L,D-transpeptidase family protein [Bacteroidota bacterium]